MPYRMDQRVLRILDVWHCLHIYFTGSHYCTQYTCMDIASKSVPGSSTDKNGLVFYFVEGRWITSLHVLHMITLESFHVQSVLSDSYSA